MRRLMPDLLVLGIYSAVTIYLFYPGLMTPDSVAQLGQARARFYTDAHPPLMAAIWRHLDSVIAGPFLPLVLQILLLCAAVSIIAISLFPTSFRYRLATYSVLVLPPVWGFVGIIWKDIWMQVALLLSFAIGLASIRSSNKSILLSVASLILLTAAAFRHNAIAAIPPFVWAVSLIITRRHVQALVTGVVATFLVAGANHVITKALTDREDTFVQVVWAFDIAGISVERNVDLFTGDYPSIKAYSSNVSDIEKRYSGGRNYICLYRECGELPALIHRSREYNDLKNLKANWIDVVSMYPVAYVRHRLNFASHLLGFAAEPQGKALKPAHFHFETEPKLNTIRDGFRKTINYLSSTPLFSVLLYGAISLIGLGCSALNLLRRPADLHPAPLAAIGLFGSGILYQVFVIASALTPDFRYSLWMISSTWLAVCILVCDKNSMKTVVKTRV